MHKRKAVGWLISFGVHVAIVAAMVIAPMLFTQALDLTRFEATYLVPPPIPYAPPPAAGATPQVPRRPQIRPATLTMPVAIPKTVQVLHDAASQDAADLDATVVGGGPGAMNCDHFQMAMLAYNLNCWLSLFNREEKTDTAKMKHSPLSTARLRFLFLAAKIWRHAGRVGEA